MISCKEYVALEKEKIKEITKDKDFYLHIFQVGDNPASNSYIKGKLRDCEEVGVHAFLHKFDESVTTGELLEKYDELWNNYICANMGVILQLPVPKHIDVELFTELLAKKHDVDGFKYDSPLDPCTPKGVVDWLEYNHIDLCGKNVCIIGRSDIVGKPLARMMNDRNATVTLCHSKTKDLEEHMKIADIIVVAIGKAKFIHDIKLPKKPIMIDVGINRDENGKLCGDVDYDNMINECSYITPVPGGVGLLTRVALLNNAIKTEEN